MGCCGVVSYYMAFLNATPTTLTPKAPERATRGATQEFSSRCMVPWTSQNQAFSNGGNMTKGFCDAMQAKRSPHAGGGGGEWLRRSHAASSNSQAPNENKRWGQVGWPRVACIRVSRFFFFLFRQLARQGVGIGCQLCVSADEAKAHFRRRRAAHAAQKDINPGWLRTMAAGAVSWYRGLPVIGGGALRGSGGWVGAHVCKLRLAAVLRPACIGRAV